MVENRAGDEVREEGDEEDIGGERSFLDFALITVHQVGDLGEGVERDPDWQDDGERGMAHPAERLHGSKKEVGVFKKRQQAEIDGDRPDDRSAAMVLWAFAGEEEADAIIEQDRADQEENQDGLPVGVEGQ